MNIAVITRHFNQRNKAVRAASLLLKASLFLPLPLFCQTRTVATAEIPFAFSVGKQIMPAGIYSLSRVTGSIYALRQRDGQKVEQVMMYAASRNKFSDSGTLSFHNYGSQYFLESFWFPNSQEGMQLTRSHGEKEVLAAARPVIASDVVIAMNDRAAKP